MDLIYDYESDCSATDSDQGNLGSREIRKVYLVTYSQADTEKFPTRRSFAEAVVKSFSGGSAKVIQWCCSQESHQKSGMHYHICVKLNRNQRWLRSKKFLVDKYGISVHFSSNHANYYTAWKYVRKEDDQAEESQDHPDLSGSEGPSTMKAHEAKRVLRKKRRWRELQEEEDKDDEVLHNDGDNIEAKKKEKEKKRKRLSAYEVAEIVISKGLRNRTDVLAFANMQRGEGKTDLAEFVINRGAKVVNEVIETAWEMETAKSTQERKLKSRIELLRQARQGECTCQVKSEWHACASQLLTNNSISCDTFGNSVKELLEKGRGKFRNIMLTGPANCGKTFLLNPLNKIYHTFTNPASTSFAWVGADKAEVVFLNDFRWSSQIIAWHDLLLMLEGQLVHLPAPKSHFAQDTVFVNDTPIFSSQHKQASTGFCERRQR